MIDYNYILTITVITTIKSYVLQSILFIKKCVILSNITSIL